MLLTVALQVVGCGGGTQNVRSLHRYASEKPTFVLTEDRVKDIETALRLAHRMLIDTPYRPEAPWIAALPLTQAEAQKLERAIRQAPDSPYQDPSYEVPLIKLYCRHLEQVLPALAEGVPVPAAAGSLLSHIASSSDQLADLLTELEGYRHLAQAQYDAEHRRDELKSGVLQPTTEAVPVDLPQADRAVERAHAAKTSARARLLTEIGDAFAHVDPQAQREVRDYLTITSVASRLLSETIAMVPVVSAQWVRSGADLQHESAVGVARGVAAAARTPEQLAQIGRDLVADLEIIEPLARALARLEHVDLERSPGYVFREKALAQVTGLVEDAVHLRAIAGGEALFYSNLAQDEQRRTGNGGSVSLAGRTQRLDYRVEPIVLASVNASAKFDLANVSNLLGIDLGYATNRVYKSGGSLETSSLAHELGATGFASDALSFGLSLFRMKSRVKIANFTNGRVQDVRVADDAVLSEAPLHLRMTQIDLGYGVAQLPSVKLEEAVFGLRYFDYSLPRILYDLRDSTPGADTSSYVFTRQSPAEVVRSRYFLAGFSSRFTSSSGPAVTWFADLDLHLGFGGTSFYFLRDQGVDNVESNREHGSSTDAVFNGSGGLGLNWRLVPEASRLRMFLSAAYHAELLMTWPGYFSSGARRVDSGAMDVFHGPFVSFIATL